MLSPALHWTGVGVFSLLILYGAYRMWKEIRGDWRREVLAMGVMGIMFTGAFAWEAVLALMLGAGVFGLVIMFLFRLLSRLERDEPGVPKD